MTEYGRIFGKRIANAVHAIGLLKTGTRYNPTPEEVTDTLKALGEAVGAIFEAHGKTLLPTETAPQPAPVARQSTARAEGWHHHDIARNVAAIPDDQITHYATRILARMSDMIEETRT